MSREGVQYLTEDGQWTKHKLKAFWSGNLKFTKHVHKARAGRSIHSKEAVAKVINLDTGEVV